MKENVSLIPVRRRQSARQITQFLEQYEASGLTQREFAASVNIGYSTFTSWLRRRRREPVMAAKPWLAVDVVKAASPSAMVRYQLEWPNGMRVNVSGGFDAREVGQLLNLVRACSP
jgi:biotin-(acetyl-CoA carboxylase) ligase